jgi:hypothetical protein
MSHELDLALASLAEKRNKGGAVIGLSSSAKGYIPFHGVTDSESELLKALLDESWPYRKHSEAVFFCNRGQVH